MRWSKQHVCKQRPPFHLSIISCNTPATHHLTTARVVNKDEGLDAQLSCPLNENESSAVWYTIVNGTKTELRSTEDRSLSGNNLTISNITIDREGQYVAFKRANAGHLTDKCIFTVHVNGKIIPTVLLNYQNVTIG